MSEEERADLFKGFADNIVSTAYDPRDACKWSDTGIAWDPKLLEDSPELQKLRRNLCNEVYYVSDLENMSGGGRNYDTRRRGIILLPRQGCGLSS